MRYGDIVSFGFKNAWKYKALWVLGFLVSGGGGTNFRGNFGDNQLPFDDSMFRTWFDNPVFPIAIIALLLGVFLLAMVFIILSIIANGGLIDAARRIKNGEAVKLGACFKTGASFFWPLLGRALLFFVIIFALLIILIIIGVICFYIKPILGFFSLIFLIPVLLGIIFVFSMLSILSARIIVIEGKPIFDSIADSYTLFKKNLGPMLAFFFIELGLSIAIVLTSLLLFVFLAIPFIALGFVSLWPAIILGFLTLMIVSLPISGYTGASLNLMNTEFYFQVKEEDGNKIIAFPGEPSGTPPPPPLPPPPYNPINPPTPPPTAPKPPPPEVPPQPPPPESGPDRTGSETDQA